MLLNNSSSKKYARGSPQSFTKFNYLQDGFEKYNYPLYPYDQQQELNFDYRKEPFSFDNQMHNNRINYQQELAPFDGFTNSQTIAKSLIQQNSILKQKLKESDLFIKQLQKQLQICNDDLNMYENQSKREKQSFQRTINELRLQIMSIIQSNSLLQKQISSLSPFMNHKSNGSDIKLSAKGSRSLGKINPKINHAISNNSFNDDLNQEKKKVQELIDSINSMHSKIMGFRAENLRQLWRWLKNMGQIYSSLRKWSDKYGDIGHHPRMEKLKEAVFEVFSLIS